jgi:hypothetical protein
VKKNVWLETDTMVMAMSLLDLLSGIVTIAGGVVLGTLLTWVISYYIGKRVLLKLLKSLSENPEIIETIQTLRKNTELEQNRE